MKHLQCCLLVWTVAAACATAAELPEASDSEFGQNLTTLALANMPLGVTGNRLCSGSECASNINPSTFVFTYAIGNLANFTLTLAGAAPFATGTYGLFVCNPSATVPATPGVTCTSAAVEQVAKATLPLPTTSGNSVNFNVPGNGTGLVFFLKEPGPFATPPAAPGVAVIAAVPEPMSALLLGSAVLALAIRRLLRDPAGFGRN